MHRVSDNSRHVLRARVESQIDHVAGVFDNFAVVKELVLQDACERV